MFIYVFFFVILTIKASPALCMYTYQVKQINYFNQVNYNDGSAMDTRENADSNWQENLSDYNSDFSAPSGTFLKILSFVFSSLLVV